MSDGGRLSLRATRWLGRLRAPTTEPAAMIWAAFDEDQRTELLRSAADVRHATQPDRAVVLAALQRQIEDRACRWPELHLLAVVLGLTVVLGATGNPWSALTIALPWAFGVLTEPGQATRARRANEQLAREGGYPVPADDRRTTWGIDRPVLGDPLVPTSVALAALVTPILAVDLLPVTAAVWTFPWSVVGALLILATGRAFARGLREGSC